MFKLGGKVAVVTGGGSGIGKAVALLFAEQGAEVHTLDLNKKNCSATVDEIIEADEKAFAHACYITSQKEINEIFSGIANVDILVNSAGISHIGDIESTAETDMGRLYNVKIKCVHNCMRAAIPTMKANKRGVILNLASIANIGLQHTQVCKKPTDRQKWRNPGKLQTLSYFYVQKKHPLLPVAIILLMEVLLN